ncbi:helix-turn-helix transcriptional regulator [Corallococcus exercitus]|uniref:Helix-turn-helix transcriptional regulator n=1 Tax=Corallococcus exercitus TaxID=2316736 RepID=A0A7Y4K2M0_9BACT|nr:helix-turn-helix transcriptional regulator [Corallococcus exercitus]NOK23919.1 helix-turn-helix transcriptional regulator [Corallococcus carmarthensis]NTX58689.1 helix-turn-helix transcriptional regulator [Myxococcus sp. CA039A]
MDRKAKVLAELIDSRGSRRAFAEEIGLPPTTLQSMLTRGVGRASIDNVIKVCRALGITVEDLENMAHGENETTAVKQDNEKLSEEEILTLAAHQVGHDGPLTEKELEQIKLAVKIALAKDNK